MASLEPATTARVRLVTNKGPIEIEIWAKEVPNTARHFIQNCVDKKYNGHKFGKAIRGYLIETSGGGDEVNQEIRSEFHSRLKFNKKGMVGAVLGNKMNSASVDEFFITMKPTPEFDREYVLFGKIVGETMYNAVKINEGEVLEDDQLKYPVKIEDTEVLVQYFDDIRPQRLETQEQGPKKKRRIERPKIKVSLDYESEQEELDKEKDTNFRMKSAHELLNDKRLSNKLYPSKLDDNGHSDGKESKTSNTQERLELEWGTNLKQDNLVDHPTNDSSASPQRLESDDIVDSTTLIRDPAVDSDYDSDLDLAKYEAVDQHKLQAHSYQNIF